jgi:hypothetical protein
MPESSTMAVQDLPPRNDPPQDPATLADLYEQLVAAGAPPQVLEAIAGAENPDDAVARLVAGGLLPDPEESVIGLLDTWSPLLDPGTRPFDAELSTVEFVALTRAAGVDDDDLTDVLCGMIEAAEGVATPEAVAMTRALGVVGPEQIRSVAAAAADRLVAAGLDDPHWAAELGRPKFVRCFGYGDPFGSQDVLALVFGYGRSHHVIAVLIDHGLGGGIKDCYPAEGPRRLRSGYEIAARRIGMDLLDYTPEEAMTILEPALAAPPCPVEYDQIEDVDTYLPLLRARVALLREATPPRRTRGGSTRAGRTRNELSVHRLKITLRGSKPPIWRRVEVASATDLSRLHEVVQAAFGWHGSHMWVFSAAAGEFGDPDPELGHADAGRRTLAAVAPRAGDRIRYTYDFGDDWEHDILVEDVAAAEPDVVYPLCRTGRRACPPEDCGGIWGYQDVLEVLADPDHPEHTERMEWLGLQTPDELDPAHFDLAETNGRLRGRFRSG